MGNDIDAKLGARIAKLREQNNFTLDGLANASGISRATLSRIERGETSPSAQNLGNLCTAFQITMSQLLYEIEENEDFEILLRNHQIWVEKSGFIRTQIAPSARNYKTEIIIGEIPVGVTLTYESPNMCGIEEHIIMLEGQLKFEVNNKVFNLIKGDCLRFKINGKTEFHNDGNITNKYIVVVVRE